MVKVCMRKTNEKEARKNIVGLKMKELREARGLSQRDLAKEFQLIGCDIDQNVITRTERGERKVSDKEILAIAIVFGVTAADLFENVDKNVIYDL